MNKDLFGNEIIEDVLLRDKYIEPPFSVLDTRSGNWQGRKRSWLSRGIKSEIGRKEGMTLGHNGTDPVSKMINSTSIFDPVLCELMYRWFCPEGGTILDPFAGGSVRGIVANYLGYHYTGVELREEQVASNIEQGESILPNNCPEWICGDSNKILETFDRQFDFIFSCPPYFNLEKYSDLPEDLSNMDYKNFYAVYCEIIHKAIKLLKYGSFACFVVGEVRNNRGNYVGLVPDTINAFVFNGMAFYNEAILLNSTGSAALRADGNMKNLKLVKIHQNVLIFKKI